MTQYLQTKKFVFTLNNYTEDEYNNICRLGTSDEIVYLVVGRETAGTGTPHLQGFVVFRGKKRFARVKVLLGSERVFVEQARGSDQQASEYCKKEGDFVEYGAIDRVPTQGRRSDLAPVAQFIREGSSIADVGRAFPEAFIKFSRGIEKLADCYVEPRNFRSQCVYLWGPTGTGKTRRAYAEALALGGGAVSWVSDNTLKWFDGYDPRSKCVILDDFAGDCKVTLLLRLIDRYPYKVPIKGGFLTWRPRIIYITSNYPPDKWYGHEGEHYNALLRRIDEIIHIE